MSKNELSLNEALDKVSESLASHIQELRDNKELVGNKRKRKEEEISMLRMNLKTLREKKFSKVTKRYPSLRNKEPQSKEEIDEVLKLIDSV